MPPGETIHVYPLGDLLPHNTVGESCPCAPRVEYHLDGKIVIHDAWDGREKREMEDRCATPR
jgi:hypothetical protein